MIFKQITLTWGGKDYVIPPERVLGCIAQIEDVISISEMAQVTSGRVKLAKVAQAYGAALRWAGARVTDDEVYNGLFGAGGTEMYTKAQAYVFSLQVMMIPPEHMRAEEGKAEATVERADSSLPVTSSSSAKAG